MNPISCKFPSCLTVLLYIYLSVAVSQPINYKLTCFAGLKPCFFPANLVLKEPHHCSCILEKLAKLTLTVI